MTTPSIITQPIITPIWVEKYRPKTLKEVCHQPDIIHSVHKMIANKQFQHIMFYGPSGVGKTTVAKILTFAGSGGNMDNILELNASHERGIDTIRDRVKNFAKLVVKNNQKWRYIILDECDSLSKAAQAALRRIMEEHMYTTRFFLLCNYKSKIIMPIMSRCASFRFKTIPNHIIQQRLNHICYKEQIDIDTNALQSIILFASGDLRKAIILLQTCFVLAKEEEQQKQHVLPNICHITSNHIDYVTNGRSKFRVMFHQLLTQTSRTFNDVNSFAKNVIAEAMDIFQILYELQSIVLSIPITISKGITPTLDNVTTNETTTEKSISNFEFRDENQKANILIKISQVDINLTERANEYFQLMDILSLFFT